MSTKADFAMVGLAVMGKNLAMNIESRGYTVALYNRDYKKVQSMLTDMPERKFIGSTSYEDLCSKLKRPRKIMMLIRAGSPVDQVIDEITPYLEKGDVLIDGGNSYFADTDRRTKALREKGIFFIGTGVSGGEEGALHGPSLMPGGAPEAWPEVKEIFQAMAAKASDGLPCCDWIGENGAGHFVKMVHNGIEYGDMQMISEAYFLMKKVLKLSNEEMHSIFTEWNKGELNSYLIEITADILKIKDTQTDKYVLDIILDAAGQKGTGKWTSEIGLDLGIAIPTISEAVFARCISAVKAERLEAAKVFGSQGKVFDGDKTKFIEDISNALYASKICSYAQGFQLIRAAAKEYKWKLNYGKIAMAWRGGCIIRAKFLQNISFAYNSNPELINMLLDPFFAGIIKNCEESWRKVVCTAFELGIAIPTFSSALCYYDSYKSQVLPANMIQAQRDFFGAHTYERIDGKRGEFFHTDWTGHGGKTTSSTYNV
ncbi:MAG TPA: phosphogluconate dehydrogenase (NADP(+)-dependent, decarboxylating) [Lentisphaeria bacterium]|nr:MAG: phosphogluconate dehydrogenase (NADP(+)-dependent, decarboxylating) [Lentisphaerae bacterium GWF2_38_69]HBM15839.1 phosphogluconate dehydrogenase (NADP(+)-dependent, decarboxylating) [Lentisphaeria bacterium]